MPQLISRQEALDRIRAEGGSPPCLMCAINARRVGAVYAIHEDQELIVMLPRYVRRWGQVLVTPKPHHTAFSDIEPALWARTCAAAHRAARLVELQLKPRRVYVASTGSSAGELTQSSMHLHIHVIPLYELDDKPADIFSWQDGIYVAEPDEWESLRDRLAAAWPNS
jgi:diadenosine tetraphosphate (Ap4A) HIT family hydrolase